MGKMKTIRNGYIKQAVLSSIVSLTLIITAYLVGISTVFARDNGLTTDVQVDILMQAAKENLESERWIDALESFEKANRLGVSLPVEFHFLYGKALFKTGNYEHSLSSITNYLTLVSRDGECYE